MRFKKRNHLYNLEVHEAAVDVEATASHLQDLAKLSNEGGYTEQQIFRVDETDFHWKKMPSTSMTGFKGLSHSLVWG